MGLDEFRVETVPVDAEHDSGLDADSQDVALDSGMPDSATAPGCTSNAECTELLSADAGAEMPAVCIRSEGRCAALLSEHCNTVTGEYLSDDAIVIGSLFSTTGAQADTNIARQESAILAVEEINEYAHGIPLPSAPERGRPLVLVSCDEAADLKAASEHLVFDLRVPAIIGPNTSQDTIDLTQDLTAEAGTVLVTPTAVASSIADLVDNDLTWAMVPSDEQRAPLMIQQINEIEARLRTERNKDAIKLAIVYRGDKLGEGTRVSLNALELNGKPIADPANLNIHVSIASYDYRAPDQASLVASLRGFAPDIVVLAGTAEAITKVMVPLETSWNGGARPEYVLIDSVKVPDLLLAAADVPGLRSRVRGTGVTPSGPSQPVYDEFRLQYAQRFPGKATTISGMGPAHDATYAVAYALATSDEVSGAVVARGLRKLSGGAALLELQTTKILAAFQALTSGENIRAIGTFGPMQWLPSGAISGGTLEMWCIGTPGGIPEYQSAGLTYDISTNRFAGAYQPCQ